MGRTGAALVLVFLAAAPAVLADDGAVRRTTTRRQDTFGSDYLPPAPAVAPTPPPGIATPPAAQDPAVLPAPDTYPVPAAVSPGCPCGPCCNAPAAPHQKFECIHRLIDWWTYCPLKKGVNCNPCGHDGHGDCCCYHCFPPLYLFLIQPCVEGNPPSMPCWGCSCCGGGQAGGGPPTPVIRSKEATQKEETPEVPKTYPDSDASSSSSPPAGDQRGFFGQRHRLFSLSSGFGCSSVGCR
jgi:hypothetical protein